MSEKDMNIRVQVTCEYEHEIPFHAKAEINVSAIKSGDTELITDTLKRMEIAMDRHFREHHPGVYPENAGDAYYAAKRKAGREPSSDEIFRELERICPELYAKKSNALAPK